MLVLLLAWPAMNEQRVTMDLSTEGFQILDYPGPSFRPIPAFSLDVPPGWLVDDFPASLCVIGTPAESEEPWSNVFVQHHRVLATTALEEVALESWEKLQADFPDVELVDERLVEFEQFQYIREATLTFDGEKVTRLDAHFFAPFVDEVTADLFHIAAMHPVAAGDDRTLTYVKMLASFRFSKPENDNLE